MMKRFVSGILVFLFLFSSVVPVALASEEEQTLGELKALYQSKLKEKEENDNKSASAKAEIAENQAAIAEAEKEIHVAEGEMEEAQTAIDESNTKISELSSQADYVLRYLQEMQGNNAYVEYVSGASSMTDFVMRVAVVEQLSDKIHSMMDELDAEIKKNEELKAQLEEKKVNLEKQQQSYEATIASRTNDLASYDKYALDIDTQIKSLKSKLDSAETNCALYAPSKGDDAIISKDCVKPKPVTPPSNSGGSNSGIVITNDSWLKPLVHGRITSEVGYRWGSYHNALDIGGNAEGTPVYAAAAGVVSGKIYRYNCGGNMLYIDVNVGGVSYTTYYYHLLDFNVEIGDVVDQNTIIGWVGGGSTASSNGGYDNCTTGAHLHFGVAKGYYNGYSISRSNVITPPGFPNSYGWSFYSRYDMY